MNKLEGWTNIGFRRSVEGECVAIYSKGKDFIEVFERKADGIQ